MAKRGHGRFRETPLDLAEEGGEIVGRAEIDAILNHGKSTVPILEFEVGLRQPAADPGTAIQPPSHLS